MHGRVGGTLACYRSMCSVSRRGAPLQPKASALPPGQADPPRALCERARARLHAAGEGRHVTVMPICMNVASNSLHDDSMRIVTRVADKPPGPFS